YSLVIQPLPWLRIHPGTLPSMVAVQMTRVFPISIRHEPSAVRINSGVRVRARIWSSERLSERKIILFSLLAQAPSGCGPWFGWCERCTTMPMVGKGNLTHKLIVVHSAERLTICAPCAGPSLTPAGLTAMAMVHHPVFNFRGRDRRAPHL